MNDLVRILAAWALVHESADEGWKAAVARGRKPVAGETDAGADTGADTGAETFTDGLAALVAEEKDRLKGSLADLAGGMADEAAGDVQKHADIGGKLDALGFELAELRGRIESLQASVDAIAARGKV